MAELQTKLAQLGYTNPDKTPLATDGQMGRHTREALKAFQHEHHLKEDGLAGRGTLKAIDATLKERGVKAQGAPIGAPITEQTHGPNRPASPQITDPAHPGNSLFRQAQTGMQAIDAKYGRTSDHQTDNAAGHLAVTAQRAGMTRIEAMELGGTSGDKIIAVQGQPGTAHSKVIAVPTVEALNTPLAQSSQAFTAAQQIQRPANPQSQQPLQSAQPDPAQAQPAMSRCSAVQITSRVNANANAHAHCATSYRFDINRVIIEDARARPLRCDSVADGAAGCDLWRGCRTHADHQQRPADHQCTACATGRERLFPTLSI